MNNGKDKLVPKYSKRVKNYFQETSDILIKVAYLNIRCLGDGSLRSIKLDLNQEELSLKPDVLLMEETRCQTKRSQMG